MKLFVVIFQGEIDGIFSTWEKAYEHLNKSEWVDFIITETLKNITKDEFIKSIIDEYTLDNA